MQISTFKLKELGPVVLQKDNLKYYHISIQEFQSTFKTNIQFRSFLQNGRKNSENNLTYIRAHSSKSEAIEYVETKVNEKLKQGFLLNKEETDRKERKPLERQNSIEESKASVSNLGQKPNRMQNKDNSEVKIIGLGSINKEDKKISEQDSNFYKKNAIQKTGNLLGKRKLEKEADSLEPKIMKQVHLDKTKKVIKGTEENPICLESEDDGGSKNNKKDKETNEELNESILENNHKLNSKKNTPQKASELEFNSMKQAKQTLKKSPGKSTPDYGKIKQEIIFDTKPFIGSPFSAKLEEYLAKIVEKYEPSNPKRSISKCKGSYDINIPKIENGKRSSTGKEPTDSGKTSKSKIDVGALDYRCLIDALVWNGEKDISGWYLTERLCGVNFFWDGNTLWTKYGTEHKPPEDFIKDFPKVPLVGILFCRRNNLVECLNILRTTDNTAESWSKAKFIVYDMPTEDQDLTFEKRLKILKEILPKAGQFIKLANYELCPDKDYLKMKLDNIKGLQGEGVFLKNPDSSYFTKKTEKGFFKVLIEYESTAIIRNYNIKKNDREEMIESFSVESEDNQKFSIWVGIPEAIKKNPPPIGTKIIYKHHGQKSSGVPKKPMFFKIK